MRFRGPTPLCLPQSLNALGGYHHELEMRRCLSLIIGKYTLVKMPWRILNPKPQTANRFKINRPQPKPPTDYDTIITKPPTCNHHPLRLPYSRRQAIHTCSSSSRAILAVAATVDSTCRARIRTHTHTHTHTPSLQTPALLHGTALHRLTNLELRYK